MSGIMTYFGGDNTGFMRALKGMEQGVSKTGSKISADLKHAVGAYVGYEAFKHLIGKVVELSTAIHNFAKQQNISYEAAQRLGSAAAKNGQTMEDFGTSLNKMAASRAAAAEKDDAMLANFERFGVTLADLQNPMTSNYDLMVKIGKAMKGMRIDAGTQAAFRDLFGRSGSVMIQSIIRLGEMKPVKLIADDDIEAIHEMERSIAKAQKNWAKMSAGPIGNTAKLWGNLASMLPGGDAPSFDKIHKQLVAYTRAHPDERENINEAWKSYKSAMLFGGDEEQQQARENLYHPSYSKHGKVETEKFFGKDIANAFEADEKDKRESAKKRKEGGNEDLFENTRPEAIAKARKELEELATQAIIKRMSPLDQEKAKRAEINKLLEQANYLQDEPGYELDAIEMRKKALKIQGELDNPVKAGKLSGYEMRVDDMAKNNLTVGARAYDPLMNSQKENTVAIKALTRALSKTASSDSPDAGYLRGMGVFD